jgi:membrane-associated PAP2 superfamily phosphatase
LEHVASDERTDKVISSLIVAAGLAMLISPIWILEYVNHAAGKLGIITAFLVVFVLLLEFATPARPFETVAAAAA